MHEYGYGKFLAGMTTGLMAGAVVGMTLSPSRREIKRAAHKAAKHIGDAVDTLSDAMGM